MCIHLMRQYRCWTNPPDDSHEPEGHFLEYIVRCAVPDPTYCLDEMALPWKQDVYDVPCPDCSGKFVHPDVVPIHSFNSDDASIEARDGAKTAVVAYTNTLCDYLSVALHSELAVRDDVHRRKLYQVGKLEVACRFNKDHFDEEAFCMCQETNEWPEYRNLSAASRFVPARGLLYPRENRALRDRKPIDYTKAFSERSPQLGQLTDAFQQYRDQKTPAQLNPRLRNATILPYMYPRHEPDKYVKMVEDLIDLGQRWIDERGGEIAWMTTYIAARPRPSAFYLLETNFPSAAWESLSFRRHMTLAAAEYLVTDEGLTEERMRSIFDQVMKILEPAFLPFAEGGNMVKDSDMSDPPCPGLRHLLDSALYLRPDKYIAAVKVPKLLGCATFDHLKYYQWDNAATRVEDEHARQASIQAAVHSIVSKEEWEKLEKGDEICWICREAMTGDGPFPPRPSGAAMAPATESEDAMGHYAVRVACPARHLIGMKCWMTYGRFMRFRYVEGGDETPGLVCDLCGVRRIANTEKWKFYWEMTLMDLIDETEPIHTGMLQTRVPFQWTRDFSNDDLWDDFIAPPFPGEDEDDW